MVILIPITKMYRQYDDEPVVTETQFHKNAIEKRLRECIDWRCGAKTRRHIHKKV
jgi:uncharacterized short protein YbdD (DUF466 family)